MKTSFKIIFILLVGFLTNEKIYSQVYIDSIFNPKIKTVQIYREGWELSNPVIYLNSNDKLKVGFDDFNNKTRNYCYTINHCNSNWEPTNLAYSEYCDGYEQNQITTHLFSTNTLVSYIHYTFDFPNENCIPKISGNYILKVFEDFDTSKVLFIRKFYIVEPLAGIEFSIIRPEISKYMARYQQYKIKVTPNVSDYSDLRTEIKTVVMQNYNYNSRKECFISRLDNTPSLIYDDQDSNLFSGGNEYRNFDLKSIKYKSPHIKSIKYDSSAYIISLNEDEWRNKKQYFTEEDINGSFYIENKLGVEKDIDADYVKVNFTLSSFEPLVDGDLYVFGALTDWQCNAKSKMVYNFDKAIYELQLFLKQGYYNYQYAYKAKNSDKVDLSYVERDHYETENDYLVFVYYKPFTSRYEKLIGYKITNSVKKTE